MAAAPLIYREIDVWHTELMVVAAEPSSSSELYDRVGYPTLARLGLIPYQAFRDAFAALATTGATSSTRPERSGLRRRVGPA